MTTKVDDGRQLMSKYRNHAIGACAAHCGLNNGDYPEWERKFNELSAQEQRVMIRYEKLLDRWRSDESVRAKANQLIYKLRLRRVVEDRI